MPRKNAGATPSLLATDFDPPAQAQEQVPQESPVPPAVEPALTEPGTIVAPPPDFAAIMAQMSQLTSTVSQLGQLTAMLADKVLTPAKTALVPEKETEVIDDYVAPVRTGNASAAEEGAQFELMYIPNVPAAIPELQHHMPDECIVTFRRGRHPKYLVAKFDCEECYVRIMQHAGPGAENPDNVIVCPPNQLKSYMAMRQAAEKDREKKLEILKQPWKLEQIMKQREAQGI